MTKQSPPRNAALVRRNLILAGFAAFLALWPLLANVAPLQDQMDWVLQAKIIADPTNPQWQAHYDVAIAPVPNLLGTLVIAALAKVLPVFRAAAVAYAAYLVLFVIAYAYFVRADGKDRPAAELAGVVFAANHFFLMGFFNFVLGLALAFLALGILRRHKQDTSPVRWLPFAVLTLLTYLSHFLTFALLGLAVLVWTVLRYRRDRRWAIWPALSFLPSLACLAWYVSERSSEFWFHYAFHNPLYYVWYKVGPWAVASSYYPLTPAPAVWINALLNAAAIAGIAWFILAGLRRKRFALSDPFVVTALLLFVIGLLTPTRIYELLRPGQRLIFAGVLMLFATATPSPMPTKRRQWLVTAAVAALLAWNAVWWFQAERILAHDTRTIEAEIPPGAKMLILADSHFHFRENRSYREKAIDPYSYPNSVNPLRYLPYHRVITAGGYLRALFGTGVVSVREIEPLPDVNRLWHLDDPDMAGAYTHLVATGMAENLVEISGRAAPLFAETYRSERLLLMRRIAP